MITIGENIRRYRKEKNMTQKDVGDYIGISNTYLSDLEVGRTNPSIKTLKKLQQHWKSVTSIYSKVRNN